jgi:hypothetical protein
LVELPGWRGASAMLTWPSISTLSKVGAADERDDLAALRAHRHQRAVGDIAVGQRAHLLGDNALRLGLQARVERGVDAVAGLVERLRPEKLFELLAHVEREMRRGLRSNSSGA